MGKSATILWELCSGGTCYYSEGCFYANNNNGELIRKKVNIIHLSYRRTEVLNSIIHEINECEITNILNRFKMKNAVIKLNPKLAKKYGWIFNHKSGKIDISHILSVAGTGNCILDRRHYQLRW